MKVNIQKISKILIITTMLMQFILSYFVSIKALKLLIYEKIFIIWDIFLIIPIIYAFIKKLIKFDKSDIFILIIFIGLILSYIFSVDRDVSLYGKLGRYEGVLIIIYYYVLYYLSRLIKDKKQIITLFIIFGLIEIFHGYITVGIFNKAPLDAAKGIFGNQNFYSTFMTMEFSLVLIIYLFKNIKQTIPLILLFSIGIMIGNSMSGILSCIIIFIISFILGIKRENKQEFIIRYLISLIIIFVALTIVTTTTNVNIVKEVGSTASDTSTVIKEKQIPNSYGTNRFYIWKNTIKKIPNYLLTGSGVDTFNLVFDNKLKIDDGDYHAVVDKAHCEPLQILITEGILSLLGYLGLLIYILKINIKNNDIAFIILFVVLAYFIQSLFNIRITRIAPYYFIFLGLINSKKVIYD